MSMWSTRSEASMNDIDFTKRGLRMGRRGDGLSRSLARTAGDAGDRRFDGESSEERSQEDLTVRSAGRP